MRTSRRKRCGDLVVLIAVLCSCCSYQCVRAEGGRSSSRESNDRGSGEKHDCALLLKRHYVPHGEKDRGYNDPYSGTYGNEADRGYYNDVEPHEVICIKYADVNKAVREAKRRTNFIRPRGIDDPLPTERDIAPTGELTLETTRILAGKFRLTHDEISNALPLIDVSQTDLWNACPAHVKPIPCTVERFRTQDARCNNIKHPSWGVTNTPFVRFLPQVYSNGIDGLRLAKDGGDLPNPRAISNFIHRDFDEPSPMLTILVMSWGQFIDHDLTLAAPPRDEQDLDFDCCGVPPEMQHPLCLTIDVSPKDPFYGQFNRRCIEFKRSLAGQRPNCALGPRTHINILSHTVDANFIYGSSDALSARLRAFDRGLMRTWDRFRDLGLKPILPPESENPERDCIGRPRNLFCFIAGDERVNEQIHLTVLHTFYVRDHNRFALELGRLNPHWDDERTYQETRHILAAMVQYIVYHEYLPMALGPDIMTTYNLTLVEDGYWDGYDPDVNFALANSFQAAAFRFGHTFIQGMVRRYNKYHEFLGQTPLRELLQQPFVVYEPGKLDELALGLINTPAQTYDPFITQEVTEHLFQNPEEPFGRDLISINLQRAREHGVPGYNAFREWCGLGRVDTFEELEPFLNNGTALRYSKIYKHPDDIDLWSGGISERIIEGGMIGPTFACVVGRQFQNLRRGDRYWFENPNFPSSFTPEQLREIRTASQAKIICANGDDIPTIQRFVLRLAHPVYNPRVRCEDLPDPDLSYWREDPKTGHWPTASDEYRKRR